MGCGRSAWGSISANAASHSAWPEARVVTAPTIRPLRFFSELEAAERVLARYSKGGPARRMGSARAASDTPSCSVKNEVEN